MKRALLYVVAVVWILAFVWQTIAHAEAMSPMRLNHNGSSMTGVLDFDTGQISSEIRPMLGFNEQIFGVNGQILGRDQSD